MTRALTFFLIGVFSLFASVYTGLYFEKGSLIQYLSYPNILLPFIIFIVSLINLNKREWLLVRVLPRDWKSWTCVIATTVLLLTYEPFSFKIVYDEPIQAVTAEVMHYTRTVILPIEANNHSGSYQFYTPILEKRPFFFPFLVSVVHDITGYRYINGFILNGALTFLLLILINFLGTLFGSRKGGMLAVLLTGTIPLFSQMATSGGQEILNLVMLCMAAVLSFLYFSKPNAHRLVPLVFCLILFFQIRYENGIYLIPFGILILIGWQQARKPILPGLVMASPLFLIIPTIHYLIVSKDSERYFQSGPNGREVTFSLSYFSENVEAAGEFLFSVGSRMPNSLLVTILGLSACILFLHYYFMIGRRKRHASASAMALLILFFGVVLHLCLIFFFNFGVFNMPVTSRLSMPLLLLLVLVCPFCIRRYGRRAILVIMAMSFVLLYFVFLNLPAEFLRTKGLQFALSIFVLWSLGLWIVLRKIHPMTGGIAVLILYTVTISLPLQRAHVYSQVTVTEDTVDEEFKFIKDLGEDRFLWISSTPYAALLMKKNCMPTIHMRRDPGKMKVLLEDKEYEAVYIVRRFERDADGILKPMAVTDEIDPDTFRTRPVRTKRFGSSFEIRFEELIEVIVPNREKGNEGSISSTKAPPV
jgi:hypothetical protein